MFRVRNVSAFRLPKKLPFKRPFSDGYRPLSRVRLLAPTAWSVAACSTIYIGCAAFEVYRDARHVEAQEGRGTYRETFKTFEELERLARRDHLSSIWDRVASTRGRSERPEFSEPQKLTLNFMAITTGVYLASAAAPVIGMNFVHVPTSPTNVTLLTSTFGHAGLVHLAVNMYALWWIMPATARSPIFKESNAHLTAFYLSAGILSSLAQHAAAVWPRPNFTASLGASGALFALFGIVGISFPQTNVGIIFIPGSIPITQMMAYAALFDAIGIFVRYPSFFRLGHAAHLSGLAVGVAYAKYGGDEKIWRPARKAAFQAMHLLGIL
jgi:rhomboid-like protein